MCKVRHIILYVLFCSPSTMQGNTLLCIIIILCTLIVDLLLLFYVLQEYWYYLNDGLHGTLDVFPPHPTLIMVCGL